MKRIALAFTALLLLFSTTGAIVADAKGFSGSRGGGSSFSSKPASSPVKSSPVKSTKTTKSEKAPATSKTTKSVKTTPPAQVNNFKHKPAYNSYYAKPRSNTNMQRYENKSYYSRDNGFATSLMTSIGTYLVLDAILDDGEPVYIDSETGEKVDPDELDAQPLDDQDEDSSLFVTIMFCVVAAFILITLIAIILL